MGWGEVQAAERAAWLRRTALQLGFDGVGIARADFLSEEAPRLEAWLKSGMHGGLGYMQRNFDERLDPRRLVPGTRTVVTLLYNYHNPRRPLDPKAPRIASYALGRDYHRVVRTRVWRLLDAVRAEWGEQVEGMAFVDAAPVLERAWARRSGLGWIGKNGLLLTRKRGSYHFLAELLLDVDLAPDPPATEHCGTCRRCLDACPTGAIVRPAVVDASRCISTFTIELRGPIPEPVAAHLEGWAFGCDICQEVCPWNRHATPHREPAFEPNPALWGLAASDWQDLSEEAFRELFRHSAVKRAGYMGLRRNLRAVFGFPPLPEPGKGSGPGDGGEGLVDDVAIP